MTVRDLVYEAYRDLGAYGSGEVPTDDDADIGLKGLQRMLKQLCSTGFFGPLTDVAVTDDYEAGENERVTNIAGGSVDVALPVSYTDADSGADRAPFDRSVVVVAGGSTFIYDAGASQWVEIEDLTLDSDEPLESFNLAAMLAVYVSPQFPGLEPGQVVISNATATRAALRRKQPIRAAMPRAVMDNLVSRAFGWMT